MITGYKSAGKNNEYIVTLEIDPSPENTNLHRTHKVIEPQYVKYRCRRAFVKDIKHKETGASVDSAVSYYTTQKDYNGKSLVYKKGEYIEEPFYNPNIDAICTSGIHYFLTEEQAFQFGLEPLRDINNKWIPQTICKNSTRKRWDLAGYLDKEVEIQDGVPHGILKRYIDNLLSSVEQYKEGKLHGISKEYSHNDGSIMFEEEYKNGVLQSKKHYYAVGHIIESLYDNGELKSEKTYRKDGSIESEFFYKNGMKDGVWRTYSNEGYLLEQEYKEDRLEGFERVSFNGRILDEYYNKNGVKYVLIYQGAPVQIIGRYYPPQPVYLY